jgi:hypothetical protein
MQTHHWKTSSGQKNKVSSQTILELLLGHETIWIPSPHLPTRPSTGEVGVHDTWVGLIHLIHDSGVLC